mmetsp:Transcript_42389/g.127066  ORF Transcript_42389/g.127066 Transcript_42389/m.127066 type:complete len:152 (-) Transcript_42389:1164-1619(-)
MRQLVVSVPADREADVLECLQGEACELKNVTRHCDGTIATISATIHRDETGSVLHELDKIGVGCAYGKVWLMPVMFQKPLPAWRRMQHLAYLGKKDSWTVRGRLSTEEIHANVSEAASASFDYLLLVVVAAWIAAVGLATDNAVMIGEAGL